MNARKLPAQRRASARKRAPTLSGAMARTLPNFLQRSHPAVRSQLASVTMLPDFLRAAPGVLTLDQRLELVEQALVLLEQNYVHLPLKRAMHAVDPVQRLRLLQQRLSGTAANKLPAEMEFHRELLEIFTSVRDLHTNYYLPAPFDDKVAFLPFMVEDYFDRGQRKYLVSHVMQGFNDPTFVPGVEVRYWNGVPIDRAVMTNGQRIAGSNLEARIARGVEMLTTRPLMSTLPPDEEWVVVGYRTLTNASADLRVSWLVFAPDPEPVGRSEAGPNAVGLGVDIELDWVHRARKPLFAPKVVEAELALRTKPHGIVAAAPATTRRSGRANLDSRMPDVVEAKTVTTPDGAFGYMRIRSFMVDDEAFITEVIRLLQQLPQTGLILDVRENGGGNIYASERLLQLFTPRRIEPEQAQFINTALNIRMCKRETDLAAWVPSMDQALQTGSVYSAAVPLTPAALCNSHGQVFGGPVVLITDALCYSATDIFAAGFQDHGIGAILGTDGNTGAGGANVWSHSYLLQVFQSGRVDPQSPYRALPNGAAMRVAIRRTLRVGARSGTPVEDLGVVPDERHFMTRKDLLAGNVDLINKAASLLAKRPSRKLDVTVSQSTATTVTVRIATKGLSRVDMYIDDRPDRSLDVGNGTIAVSIARTSDQARGLRAEGFHGEELVAVRRVSIDSTAS